ncbi:MAG: Acetyl-coenzyme A synthetase [Candidatus Methanofastidiosum methylothiophilum]|uniref:Acetyl-coenzyme A synthetase n=1 Tax=Candidatus Methanofastidiosum methylothiophilum TaxID=1705564 RepID=A0A150IPC2_9EURY|nr:MAG: Acetyl-coenzyme A synthetase [Candidatus Methanofastidiosum methylthiophilus]
MYEKKPWLKYYDYVPETVEYPRKTIYEAVRDAAIENPNKIAYDFLDNNSTYSKFLSDIDRCANALYAIGVRKGDRITISLPNCPQALICFYAINKLGAISSMIHPLSPPKEVKFYLNLSKSKYAITLDAFYPNFKNILDSTSVEKLILSKMTDYLTFPKKIGFKLTLGRKIKKVPQDSRVVWLSDLLKNEFPKIDNISVEPDEFALILYSGGTTGVPKGIQLSNMNFNCLAFQALVQGPISEDDSVLSILPIFHGFGLGVCVHTFLAGAAKCILVPKFSPETVLDLIKKKKPRYIAGVPTLYAALARNPKISKVDFGCIKGAFCGGDHLPHEIKMEFENAVNTRGVDITLREGYGLTESVSGVTIMPKKTYRQGSIGIPLSDMLLKVVKYDTFEEAPPGDEGEICISGPTVMMGYLDHPEETEKTIKIHPDGRRWLHTGDAGHMDSDGFFYFKQRLKRIIISSGMNVYPSQIEDVLDSHPAVALSCVIGIPHSHKMKSVKAFVSLKDSSQESKELAQELMNYCHEHLIKWSCPEEIEFRKELPLTLIGKVAYGALEKEELEKRKNCEMDRIPSQDGFPETTIDISCSSSLGTPDNP